MQSRAQYGTVSSVRGTRSAERTPNVSGGPVTDENASQDWVTAGLAELAKGGVDGVRVEVLAERLGVTKGGFYRRFKNRRALLNATLAPRPGARVVAAERACGGGGAAPLEKRKSIIKLYTERANTQGITMDLALCQGVGTD